MLVLPYFVHKTTFLIGRTFLINILQKCAMHIFYVVISPYCVDDTTVEFV